MAEKNVWEWENREVTPESDLPLATFLSCCRDSNYYHSAAWKHAISVTYAYKPHYIVEKSAGIIRGMIPLFEIDTFLSGRHLTAIPFSHHVPILYDSTVTMDKLVAAAIEKASTLKAKYIEIRGSAQQLSSRGFAVSAHNVVSSLDLTLSNNIIWGNIDTSTRRNIRKAESFGLSVRRGVTTEDYQRFYELIVETRQSQGVPPYPSKLFKLLSTMTDSRLYVACQGDEILGGIIVLCFGKTAIYAYGASVKNQEKLRLRPNDLLFWRTISTLQEESFAEFDFGSTPSFNMNLIRYKENWGAVTSPVAYAYWLNGGQTLPVVNRAGATARFVGQVIRRTPKPVLRIIGDYLFRQLG